MKTVLLIALGLGLAASTAACGRKGDLQPVSEAPSGPAPAAQTAAQTPNVFLN